MQAYSQPETGTGKAPAGTTQSFPPARKSTPPAPLFERIDEVVGWMWIGGVGGSL
jgi:hypothetical protein